MDFEKFVDKLFWVMLLGIGGYAAQSLSNLNEKIAIVITQVSVHESRLNHLELIERTDRTTKR